MQKPATVTSVADRAGPLDWPRLFPFCMEPMQVAAVVARSSSVGHWRGPKRDRMLQRGRGSAGELQSKRYR